MNELQGRVAVITGASSGIGREAALAFSRRGCRVGVCARRLDRLKTLAVEVEEAGGQSIAEPCDVADANQIKSFVSKVLAEWGRIDIAVCNAGYGYLARVNEIEPDEMDRIWRVNFMGTLHVVQAVIPEMIRQKEGHILIVSSVVGRYSLPVSSAYCATKFAQVALAQSLRIELRNENIGVTAVYPGFTDTEFGENQYNPGNRPRVKRKGQSAAEVAAKMVGAVLKNKKELYPSFTGSLFAHFGLFFPGLTDRLMTVIAKRMNRI